MTVQSVFLRAGLVYAAANIVAAGVPFALLPLLTRVLTPAEYGSVVAFMLCVTLCQTVAGLSAHAALGVAWFKHERAELPALVGSAIGLAGGSTLVTAAGAFLIAMSLTAATLPISPLWVAAAAITAGSNVILQCQLVLWQSQQRAWSSALLQILSSLANVSLSLLLVLGLGLGGEGRNGGISAAAVLMALLALGLLWRAGGIAWAPQRQHWQSLVAFGGPLVAHALAAVLIATADRWAVSTLAGAVALGVYGAGAQLGAVMAVIADAFVKAYSPWLYTRLQARLPEEDRVAVGAIYVSVPGFLVLGLTIGSLLMAASSWILGADFREAAPLLPWFLLGGAFSGVYVSASCLFFFHARTGRLAAVTVTTALLGTALTWLLASAWGPRGAAAGFASTQGLLAIITLGVAMGSFPLPWREPLASVQGWLKAVWPRQLPSR